MLNNIKFIKYLFGKKYSLSKQTNAWLHNKTNENFRFPEIIFDKYGKEMKPIYYKEKPKKDSVVNLSRKFTNVSPRDNKSINRAMNNVEYGEFEFYAENITGHMYKNMGVAIVTNGHHHIAVAIKNNNCPVQLNSYDDTELLKDYYTDGEFLYRAYDDEKVYIKENNKFVPFRFNNEDLAFIFTLSRTEIFIKSMINRVDNIFKII